VFNDKEIQLLRELIADYQQSSREQINSLTAQLNAEKERFDKFHSQVMEFLGLVRRSSSPNSSNIPEAQFNQVPRNSWSSIRERLERREADKAEEMWRKKIEEVEGEILNSDNA
jgi:hypothetical protein